MQHEKLDAAQGKEDEVRQSHSAQSALCAGRAVIAPELSDGVVGVVDRLAALLAHDADADVRCLDHSHVIGAVADGEHFALQRPQTRLSHTVINNTYGQQDDLLRNPMIKPAAALTCAQSSRSPGVIRSWLWRR